MASTPSFPLYRKLSNERSFYKIRSTRAFDELHVIGSKVYLYSFEVSQFPDLLKIQEMLTLDEPYLLSDEREFEAMLEKAR